MIPIAREEFDRLSKAHAWLGAFSGQPPEGVASLENPHAGALHFADAKRAARGMPPFSPASCLLLPAGVAAPAGVRTAVSEDPKVAVGRLLIDLRALRRSAETKMLDRDGARVAAGVQVPASCRIEPGTVIFAGVELGENVEIHANAVIRTNVKLGAGCCIQSGAQIGEDGFGFGYPAGETSFRLAHLGGVVIEAGVDVGANTVICSGTIDPTIIGAQTRIDGMVYVGHNARIGRRCHVIAGSVVGGSAVLGDDIWVNTSAMVRGKVKIGDRAVIGAGAVVMKDVPAGGKIIGDVAGDLSWRLRREAILDQVAKERNP